MSRILVIDDDDGTRKFLRVLLSRAGFDVMEAPDGSMALKTVQECAVDLVVCDIFMPNKEGLETIRELRARFADLPIIAISGGERWGSRLDMLPTASVLGATRTLYKPFEWPDFLQLVQECLEGGNR